jgi:replication factor C subunit 3/5
MGVRRSSTRKLEDALSLQWARPTCTALVLNLAATSIIVVLTPLPSHSHIYHSRQRQQPPTTIHIITQYRPNHLSDLVAHEDIISILSKLIKSDKLPHLLLYGPPGTGKTSTIVAMAKMMYNTPDIAGSMKGSAKEEKAKSDKWRGMVLELNASDDRGIDVVRNQIKEFAGTRQLWNTGTKLIILDECDAMTNDAQFALRRIIEKYTKNVRFCLICNYVSKIIPALQSRCTRFRFAPLSKDQIRDRLSEVAEAEKCNMTKDGQEAILDLSNGDMRRVLNLLQSTSMAYPEVTQENVYLTSGSPLPNDVELILDKLLNSTFEVAFNYVRKMSVEKGYALSDILTELTTLVMSMELPDVVLGNILEGMSDVEYRMGFGADDQLQLAGLIGVFVKGRGLMTSEGGGESSSSAAMNED